MAAKKNPIKMTKKEETGKGRTPGAGSAGRGGSSSGGRGGASSPKVEISDAVGPFGGFHVKVNGSTFMRVSSKSRANAIAKQIRNGVPLKDVK